MPCTKCNVITIEQERYYHSSGIVNIFLCQTCGVCSRCHLGNDLTHSIKYNKENYDIESVKKEEIKDTKNPILDENWR